MATKTIHNKGFLLTESLVLFTKTAKPLCVTKK